MLQQCKLFYHYIYLFDSFKFYFINQFLINRSANEMDLMYQEFTSKLRKSTQELIKESDERDKQSAMMDAKLAAIRQQNKVYY